MGIGILAWGTVAGVAMVKSGLALPLMASGAPLWVIWASALCVNLRFVVFSAQWRPYFGHLPRWQRVALGYFSGDTLYVVFMQKFGDGRVAPGQVAYFCGAAGFNWLAWQCASIAGILLGDAIPADWGLGFAGTMALLALGCALVTDRSTALAAVLAGTAAVATCALPLKLNIVVAIAAAVALGVALHHAERSRPLAA